MPPSKRGGSEVQGSKKEPEMTKEQKARLLEISQREGAASPVRWLLELVKELCGER